ncbi:MAG: type II toxin-antitoxin system RelE/ParE family toxin [Bacteroidetes bacterium]|nr:type II toxin-antitoxin system RelE/ParE family toxin [Bacteroidota bacterium]MBP6722097.1 type II toxin-antitoxin system RelE/ParE family toxin [Bacteroidia bacterium]
MPTEPNQRPLRVQWTEEAEIDLDKICAFQALITSQLVADQLHSNILNQTDQLGFLPYLGMKDVVIGKMEENVRCILLGHFRVVYEVAEEEIRILRVFDMKRNPISWS